MVNEEKTKEEETKVETGEAVKESAETDEEIPEIMGEVVEMVEHPTMSEIENDAITEQGKFAFAKKTKIAIGVVAVALVMIYLGVAIYFTDHFLPGTMVNNMDCTGKTVKQVEALMQSKVEEYILTLEEVNEITEEIRGTDIGIQYVSAGTVQESLDKQNSFAWIASLFKKNNIATNVDFIYDDTKLAEVVANLDCFQEENQVVPVSAAPVYKDGTFVIQEEAYGTLIDQEQFNKTLRDSIDGMKETVNLEETNCYVLPKFTKDSEEVHAAQKALNRCLEAKITYSLDGIVVTVDASMIHQWLSVDENMNMIISTEGVRSFTNTLGDKYNTQPRAQQITTPTGKVANVQGATRGRVIGTAAECEQLLNEIKDGKVITRQPIISQHPTPEGQYAWGTTYVEVDLSAQHMWYISNGSVAFESDVVTGSPGRNTPAGVFKILEKKRNKTLVGNIVPETGKPEYETPVSYWARVTWSGIGFHDATWQPAFGGQLYKQGYGSHGCINMPLGAVARFYNMISVGCPVVIHY